MSDVIIPDVVMIPVSKIVPNTDNPNVMNDLEFNFLVENIDEMGFVENVQVVPIGLYPEEVRAEHPEAEYVLVGGENRWRALMLLDSNSEIPAVVLDEQDLDQLRLYLVRLNVIRGRIDPVRFTRLFDQLAEKYGREATREMMMFANESEFKRVYKEVRKAVPKQIADRLDKVKDEIKTIDGLADILNELFSRYGSTLDVSVMAFTFGGQTHYMVLMDKALKQTMAEIVDWCVETKTDVNTLFNDMLPRMWVAYDEAGLAALAADS